MAREETDVTSKIERLEMIEDSLKIRVSGLSAILAQKGFVLEGYPPYNLCVQGEVTVDPDSRVQELHRQFTVRVAVYDDRERVIAIAYEVWSIADFLFDTFTIGIDLSVDMISKIRVYPRLP